MIEDRIKRLRKNAGMSQEQLAVRLSVVRQTVSKWETGLSVPDAEIVIKMAELFHVSVNEILGVDPSPSVEDITEELARANALLAEKAGRERNLRLANKKRGFILLLCFTAMLLALAVKHPIVSIVLIGICLVSALLILYRNLALLTSITTSDLKIRALKATTLFDAALLLTGIAIAVLTGLHVIEIADGNEKLLAMSIVSIVMIFSGIVSPRLPFNRHTGLRLPWTVQDEDTWNIAHRVLGFTAFPIALLYIAGAITIGNFEAVTLFAVITWVGLPALISFIFYYRKMHGRL